MIYTVTFSPALDYAMWLNGITPGATNRAQRTRLYAGGKGVNVSLVLRALNVPSVCLGFAAGFTGDEIVRSIRQAGVDEQMIRLPEGLSRINVKIKGCEETEINASGPVVDDASFAAFLARIDALMPGDVLVLSGSAPAGAEGSLYGQLALRASARGAQTVVDATGSQLLGALQAKPLLIKPNLAELEELAGQALCTTQQQLHQARLLQEQGAQNVLVSLGAQGALLASPEGAYLCRAPMGAVKNTTGSGDSMVAAFLWACQHQLPDAQKLRFAVAAGSASAFCEDLASGAAIHALFEQIPQAAALHF